MQHCISVLNPQGSYLNLFYKMSLLFMITYGDAEIAVLLIITAVYAMFDVFNRRNVPNVFAYATIVIGVAMALLSRSDYLLTFGIAVAIAAIGYVIYRSGMLGGGDIFELVFISLVLPVWQLPAAIGVYQFFIPFAVSVVIAAGYAALLFIPVYYLGLKRRAKRAAGPKADLKPGHGIAILACYALFLVILYATVGPRPLGTALIIVLAIASAVTAAYETRVYLSMVSYIYPRQLDEGDMIAVGLMPKKDIAALRKKTRFGRLATARLIKDLKGTRIRIPVYRDSVPFSAFIFIGVVFSLLFGNMVLLIIGA